MKKESILIGAPMGDIVGSRFEFDNIHTTDFELFNHECGYTDDTICTIAVADAIVNGKNYRDSLLEWCRRYPHPMGGYGGYFRRWISSYDPQPYNSYGNGSEMRVSAVGWAFDDYEEVMTQAKMSAEVSHNHPEGIKGAQCVAVLIFLLRTGTIDKKDTKQFTNDIFGYTIPSFEEIKQNNSFNETCQGTVPVSIRCFLEANDFEETIRLAVSVGGDTDTLAAIAGSIAEAYYSVPPEYIKTTETYLSKEMLDVISKFNTKYNF